MMLSKASGTPSWSVPSSLARQPRWTDKQVAQGWDIPRPFAGPPKWSPDAHNATPFQITSCSVPVGQWSDNNKASSLPKPSLPLTDADKGLLRRTADRNLSEIAESLLQNAQFATFDDYLTIFKEPCWNIMTTRRARHAVRKMLLTYPEKLSAYVSGSALKNLIELLEDSAPSFAMQDLPRPDPHLLCCLDGIVITVENK